MSQLQVSSTTNSSSCHGVSENNLALQDTLYALRNETKQAFDEAKALELRWKELEREQREVYQVCRIRPVLRQADSCSKRFSPSFLLMRLRHATTAQDDLSEAVASTFVKSSPPEGNANGGRDVDEFVKEFRDLRKTYHKRVIWGSGSGKVDWRD
jgi:ESCRT-I complex subunit VPS37